MLEMFLLILESIWLTIPIAVLKILVFLVKIKYYILIFLLEIQQFFMPFPGIGSWSYRFQVWMYDTKLKFFPIKEGKNGSNNEVNVSGTADFIGGFDLGNGDTIVKTLIDFDERIKREYFSPTDED